MTVGEHLEELRRRVVFALVGFVLALVVCFTYGREVVDAFCAPMYAAMARHDYPQELVTDEVTEGIMVVIEISLITAAAFSAPWVLYQLWQFVAAGLYPHERKYVTRFLPLSVALLVGGMLFVYFLVLPWTLDFSIGYSKTILRGGADRIRKETAVDAAAAPSPAPPLVPHVPAVDGTPAGVSDGAMWRDTLDGQLKVFDAGRVRTLAFGSGSRLVPQYKLSKYISLVVAMLLTFGLSFQLPMAVLLLERIGVVDAAALRRARRYVYFAVVILSAVITPGDFVATTLALAVPLIGLYELGIWLTRFGRRPATVPAL
jgi:sec-independent protein translocase protein TatC